MNNSCGMQEKKDLRRLMMQQRNLLLPEQKAEWDTLICEKLLALIQDRKPQVVHCYLPMGSEIDIKPVITYLLDIGIKVIAPKTLKQRKLQNLVLQSLSAIEEGIYGTWHPAGNIEYDDKIDLVIMPGLAFDSDLYRLGYGAGYYDNFLHGYPNAFKAGICYPFQIVKKVPTEPHDVQLDLLLTAD